MSSDITKILVPIDFSSDSEVALSMVGSILKETGKKLSVTLLHCLDFPTVPGNYLNPIDYLGEMLNEHKNKVVDELQKVAEDSRLDGAEVNTELVGLPGRGLGKEIAEYATKNNFDLLILVSKHRKGLSNLFPGSALMHIIRNCQVPMILLSPGEPVKFKRIAFATDLSEKSVPIFRAVKRVADLLGSPLFVARVNTLMDFQASREFTEKKIEFINALGVADPPEIYQYNANEVDEGAIQFAEDHLADMIAVGTYGLRGITRVFSHSVSESLIRESKYPLLIVNGGDDLTPISAAAELEQKN